MLKEKIPISDINTNKIKLFDTEFKGIFEKRTKSGNLRSNGWEINRNISINPGHSIQTVEDLDKFYEIIFNSNSSLFQKVERDKSIDKFISLFGKVIRKRNGTLYLSNLDFDDDIYNYIFTDLKSGLKKIEGKSILYFYSDGKYSKVKYSDSKIEEIRDRVYSGRNKSTATKEELISAIKNYDIVADITQSWWYN